MKSYVKTDAGMWEYEITTDPPEAAYWTTRDIKKSEIKILTAGSNEDKQHAKQIVYDELRAEYMWFKTGVTNETGKKQRDIRR